VRELLLREGPLGPAELAAEAALLEELRAGVDRLRALGAEIELAPEVEALLARVASLPLAAA
jgi:hypothetical protein